MKALFLSLMLLLGGQLTSSFAQSHEVPMTMEPRVGSAPQFFQGYRKLKNKEVKRIMQYNEEAYRQFKLGRSRYAWGNVIGAVGGVGIGWGVAGLIWDKDNKSSWIIAGAGLAVAVASFPIYSSGNQYMRKAVDIHNEGARKYSFWSNKELHFTGSQNGIGLVLRF